MPGPVCGGRAGLTVAMEPCGAFFIIPIGAISEPCGTPGTGAALGVLGPGIDATPCPEVVGAHACGMLGCIIPCGVIVGSLTIAHAAEYWGVDLAFGSAC